LLIVLNILPLVFSFVLVPVLLITVPLLVNYYVAYDPIAQTEGLTVWSIAKAKEMFKGRKVNEEEGEKILVNWKVVDGDDDYIQFSKNDMAKMKANVDDLVYISDARKYLGGLKSVHAVYGEPHDEDGVVYIKNEHLLNGVFIEGRILKAEKEM